jgi:hypothetical protein
MALAAWRALQSHPEQTLRILAEQYGVSPQQVLDARQSQSPPPQPGRPQRQPAPGWEQPSYDDGDLEMLDPMERRLVEQEQRLNALYEQEQARQADQQLRAALGGLQQRYQADETTQREVVQRALQLNAGPEAFDTIYRAIAYERYQAAQQQAAQQRQADDAQRTQAKQQVGQLVASGGSAGGAGAPPPRPEGNMSLTEALEAAERELGVAIGH